MSGKLLIVLALLGAAMADYEAETRATFDAMFAAFDKTDDAVSYDQLTAFYAAYQNEAGDFFITEEDFCTGDKNFMADFNVNRAACGAHFKLLDVTAIVDAEPIIESIDSADIDITFLVADGNGDNALNATEWEAMFDFFRPLPFGVLHANYRNFDGTGLYDDFIASIGWVTLFSDIAAGGLLFTSENMVAFWVGKGYGNEETGVKVFNLFDINNDEVVDPSEWEVVFNLLDYWNESVLFFHAFSYLMDASANPETEGKNLQEIMDSSYLLKTAIAKLRHQ